MDNGVELTTLDESLPLKIDKITAVNETEQGSHVNSKSKFKRAVSSEVETCMLYDSARISQLLNARERTSGSYDVDDKTGCESITDRSIQLHCIK